MCWQLREYRTDRILAWFRTHDGRKNLWNFWFFRGIFPRPKISARTILIAGIFGILSITFFVLVQNFVSIFWTTLIWNFTLWIFIFFTVKISAIPVFFKKRKLFFAAEKIVEKSPVVRIGITGSFGKSSTKTILAHLLREKFGAENVLTNPGNENNEIAIARLVLKNKKFFSPPFLKGERGGFQKFFVCEIGAYKKGEIQKVCEFLKPQLAILTGLNAQHVELFGSAEKIRAAKFELAEAATEKVFFNADTPALVEIFEDKKIAAAPIGLARSVLKNVQAETDRTNFEVFGEKFELPWTGEFFAGNALLALETARELGCNPSELSKFLKKIPPLKRALHARKLESGATILLDPYSANPDGVRGAIAHLAKFSGRKIFVGIPLRELGKNAEKEHEKIFENLKKIGAEVWWLKSDFAKLGKEILEKNFHTDQKLLPKNLKKNDAVLLESRLPREIEKKITSCSSRKKAVENPLI